MKVEQMIREELVEVLDFCFAVGAWNETGKLCAVVAWAESSEEWRIAALGVSFRSRRKGLGRRLKEHVLDLARQAGVKRVTSVVHGDNRAMLRLNRSLGAAMELDADGEYVICAITL